MAGWTAGVTALFVRALVPVNRTCLGYGALVRLPVHEMFTVIIKANTIRFEEDAGNLR